jgi:NAD(P)-dependent dehydrogenase (short-subunit alcohol dehydrogenase family)
VARDIKERSADFNATGPPNEEIVRVKEFRLDGKRAVVTGGASGIGRAIASTFAASGATVHILDLTEESAQAAASEIGSAATGSGCDVSDAGSVAGAFETIARSGPLNVLVNCAGISHIGKLLSTAEEDFDRLFRVNVRGTYLCLKAGVAQMKSAGSGVILNMASIAATVGLPDRFAYSMTKGAVVSMTLSVARDYLADGIRCNCISPARVHTPFVDGFLRKNYPGQEAEMFAKLSQAQPVGRMGTPEEIALLALYLCSDAAGFITGVDYPIDGGFVNLR